ncbi:MAG: sodium:proton antiporter, partial [Bacteroidetes bacterium CG_4_10_14_3_um_filter_42_6]
MISLSIVALPLQDPILIITVMFLIILLSPMLLERIQVPGIAGLLIFGMLIGPHVFNIIPTNLEFTLFSTTGLLYLMFLAGLEIDLIDFLENKGKSLVLGLLSFIFPFVLGFAASYYLLNLGLLPSMLIGSMLSSHTLISYPIVSKAGIISTTIVTIIIGGTIIADVFALVSLQLISDYFSGLFNTAGILRMVVNFAGFG